MSQNVIQITHILEPLKCGKRTAPVSTDTSRLVENLGCLPPLKLLRLDV